MAQVSKCTLTLGQRWPRLMRPGETELCSALDATPQGGIPVADAPKCIRPLAKPHRQRLFVLAGTPLDTCVMPPKIPQRKPRCKTPAQGFTPTSYEARIHSWTHTVSVDEMPGIQALERVAATVKRPTTGPENRPSRRKDSEPLALVG